jgi:ATP-dependent RNA helicase RhlB
MRLAAQWTRDPVTIEIESEHKTTDNVSQEVYLVSSSEKYNLLRNYLKVNGIDKAIVFCNRRHQTRALAERLSRDGVKAAMMSGEIPQQKRIKTLEGFRNGSIEVLVATDVAGRGIHIDGVSHVVNYQLPEDADDYVHRIGRTGRAGATGTSICFACEDDSFLIPEIEAQTGVKLECIHPDPELLKSPEVAEKPAVEAPVDEIVSDEVSDEETAGEASCCVAESEVTPDEPAVEETAVEETVSVEPEEVKEAVSEEPTASEDPVASEEKADSSEEENSSKS